MMNRKLWRAICAALLCAALLCGTFAVAEDGIAFELDTATANAAEDDLDLEIDGDTDALTEDFSDIELDGLDLGLDDGLITSEVELGGDDPAVLSNEGENEAEPTEIVPLRITYTGSTLTKVYDTNKYGAYVKDGETVYIIKELKTIANSFKLEPADSKKADWIDGHKSVKFKLSLSQQFSSADVGEYKFKFKASLTGDDAKYYKLSNEVIEVPAEITPREVVITPTSGLTKVYGTKDPVWPDNTWLKKDESSPLHQNIGGLPGYAVPLDKNKQLSITNQAYILKEAELKGTKFFPGWLTREAGEDVRTYKILIGDMKFSSNFAPQTLKDEVFTITAKDIGDDNVTVDAIKDQEYTGQAITPELTVRYGSNTLEKGKDYSVEYSNNTEVGTAKVKLTGKGNFKGTKEVTFKIVKKEYVISCTPKGTSLSKVTGGKRRITVKWKKGKHITGYQIAYSFTKDFRLWRDCIVKDKKKTSITIKGLRNKKVYYVRIRTYKRLNGQDYYSEWSKAKKVRTK